MDRQAQETGSEESDDDLEARLERLQKTDADARKKRDRDELRMLLDAHPQWFTSDFVVKEFPECSPDLPGRIIMRLSTAFEAERYKQTHLTTDQTAERKVKSFLELVRPAVVFPEPAALTAMLNKYPMAVEAAALPLIARNEGRRSAEGKG